MAISTAPKRTLKRFHVNPLELVIFFAVAGIFGHSVYRLFYAAGDFQPNALTQLTANPLTEGRAPAARAQSTFKSLEVRCETNSESETTAQKVRLAGPLCGADAQGGVGQLLKTTVTNSANRFAATVFLDTSGGRFSTDYIPLNTGKNPISLEFVYRGGKTVTEQWTLTRN